MHPAHAFPAVTCPELTWLHRPAAAAELADRAGGAPLVPIALAHGLPVTPQEDGPGSVPCWEQSWVLEGGRNQGTNQANGFF